MGPNKTDPTLYTKMFMFDKGEVGIAGRIFEMLKKHIKFLLCVFGNFMCFPLESNVVLLSYTLNSLNDLLKTSLATILSYVNYDEFL
jgi:hypothetical protein